MNEYIDELSTVFLHVRQPEKMKDLLRGLFTPQEIVEFATRIQIVKMLKDGVGQHEIAKKLGVGVATVTRGSKELQMGRFQSI